jgi:hypothetical protein
MSKLPDRYKILSYLPSGDEWINFYMSTPGQDIYDLETAKRVGLEKYPEGFTIYQVNLKQAVIVYEHLG